MNLDRVMRASVQADEGASRFRLGSGYLIANSLVLTAAHVLAKLDGSPPLLNDIARRKFQIRTGP